MTQCIRCEKTDTEIPLLQLWYQGREIFICPQCLPVLIHKPSQLADKLPGLENIQPPQEKHAAAPRRRKSTSPPASGDR